MDDLPPPPLVGAAARPNAASTRSVSCKSSSNATSEKTSPGPSPPLTLPARTSRSPPPRARTSPQRRPGPPSSGTSGESRAQGATPRPRRRPPSCPRRPRDWRGRSRRRAGTPPRVHPTPHDPHVAHQAVAVAVAVVDRHEVQDLGHALRARGSGSAARWCPGRYSCWLRPYSTGLNLKCPPFSSSRIEQNTLGESKAGRQASLPSVRPDERRRVQVAYDPVVLYRK